MKLARRLLIKWPVNNRGPLAQLAEQVTLNHQVTGSTPVRLTTLFILSVFNFPTNSTFVSPSFVSPLLKNQSDHAWPAGFLFVFPPSERFNIAWPKSYPTIGGPTWLVKTYGPFPFNRWPEHVSGNADETLTVVDPLALREISVPNNANESDTDTAPSTLPGNAVKVVP